MKAIIFWSNLLAFTAGVAAGWIWCAVGVFGH